MGSGKLLLEFLGPEARQLETKCSAKKTDASIFGPDLGTLPACSLMGVGYHGI